MRDPMNIDDNLWFVGAYYIDRSENEEIRVVGPANHLYFASTGLVGAHIAIKSVREVDGQLDMSMTIHPTGSFVKDPAMGHIRLIRNLTQIFGRREPTYEQVDHDHPGVAVPNNVTANSEDGVTTVTYLRTYGPHYYGVSLTYPEGVSLHRDNDRRGFRLEGAGNTVEVRLRSLSDALPTQMTGAVLKPFDADIKHLAETDRDQAKQLLQRTEAEIDHLVRNGKTSGFDYGTVFPRDWMETADLLHGELSPAALQYMYRQSLKHVNSSGAGWHEDIVGEFDYERKQEINYLSEGFDMFVSREHPLSPQYKRLFEKLDELFVTRLMIDIEPHYLMGLQYLHLDAMGPGELQSLHRVAAFVIHKARSEQLITFNKLALPFKRQRGDEYYSAGNWRDSSLAYKEIHPIIAPYDVNAVFYPQALRQIQKHHRKLKVDAHDIDELIAKWDAVKDYYRFTNPDGNPAFALALYNISSPDGNLQYSQLAVNHLDEAYAFFYAEPSEPEALSFAKRLISKDYFYTESGPLIVGRDEGYNHSQYHGEVIWTKQTAFTVAGLQRQLELRKNEWSPKTLATLSEAIGKTANASLQAFRSLGAIPELHYDNAGKAMFYTDQPAPEGQMNKVQLWSAAGARVILRAAIL